MRLEYEVNRFWATCKATVEKALNTIVSEVVRNQEHYKQDHQVLFRAVEIIQIVMEIRPNSGAATTKALDDIISEVMENLCIMGRTIPNFVRRSTTS